MSLNKTQIVKSVSQDFNGFNSLCYVGGKDTHNNVLGRKEKTLTSQTCSYFPRDQFTVKRGLHVGDILK